MEATVVLPERRSAVDEAPAPAGVPWHIRAVLFASTSVIIGVLWDISWHKTIGRDTFWSPPHMAIYVGGIVAGLSCGWLVLRTTFAGSDAELQRSVRFWRYFYGPLGAWVSIWGALAMITSGPFDDWWHNAYGLDVQILSPPHAVLAAGIMAVNIGALLMVLPLQNRAVGSERRTLGRMHAYAAGLLLLMVAIFVSEYHYKILMHTSRFYIAAGVAFPWVLAAGARSSALRWPATTIAAIYTAVLVLVAWTLQLFPAEPRLAPIYQDITHMVPTDFPLLLVVPALAIDLVMQRFGDRNDWGLSVALGAGFFVSFLVAQWLWAYFMLSDYAENFFFFADNYPYSLPRDTYFYRGEFLPLDDTTADLRTGLLIALAVSTASARIGLWWGAWMRSVRR